VTENHAVEAKLVACTSQSLGKQLIVEATDSDGAYTTCFRCEAKVLPGMTSFQERESITPLAIAIRQAVQLYG
jgi:hypothetical protein